MRTNSREGTCQSASQVKPRSRARRGSADPAFSRDSNTQRHPLGLLRVQTLPGSTRPSMTSKVIPLHPERYLRRTPNDIPIDKNNHIDIGISVENGPEVSRKQLLVLKSDTTKVVLQSNPKSTNSVSYQRSCRTGRRALSQGHKVTLRAMDYIFLPSGKGEFSNVFVIRPLLTEGGREGAEPTSLPTSDTPRKGDRYRVYYHNAKDFFGYRSQAGGWNFGTVFEVQRTGFSYRLNLKMDSGVIERGLLPTSQVQRIVRGEQYECSVVEETGHVAYTTPEVVELGDLVVGNKHHGEFWLRGRVVATSGNRCSVAYDDGEVEENIPLGHVRLIGRSRDAYDWLRGITMSDTKEKIAAVSDSMEVSFSKGRHILTYDDALSQVCVMILSRASKVLSWPSQSKFDTVLKTECRSHWSPASVVPTIDGPWTPKRMCVNLGKQSQLKLWIRCSIPQSRKNLLRRAIGMHSTLANTIRNALNSAESHVGGAIVSSLVAIHYRSPNSQLCRELVGIMSNGLRVGNDLSPDFHRIALATDFVGYLLRECGMSHQLASLAGDEFWKEIFQQLAAVRYCIDSVEDCYGSAPAVERVAHSLYVHSSCAKLLGNLLQGLLKSSLFSKECLEFTNLPFVGHVICFGVSRAVKLTIDIMVKAWIMHGYIFSNRLSEASPAGSIYGAVPNELRQLLFKESKLTLEALGVIASHLMRLCDAEGPEQNVSSKAYLVRDSVDRHIQNYGTIKGEKIDIQMKIVLITAFDENIVPGLRKELVNLFQVGENSLKCS